MSPYVWVQFDEDTCIRLDLILGVKRFAPTTVDKDGNVKVGPKQAFVHVTSAQGFFQVQCSYEEAVSKLSGH